VTFISTSQEHTLEIAAAIAPLFSSGDVIILQGELAAGKTYFVKGFASYYHKQEAVNSPTFSIANFYTGKDQTLLHMDLYRLKTIEEFNDLGIEEYFSGAIVLIEWGGMLLDHLDEYFLISFGAGEKDADRGTLSVADRRILTFSFKGERYRSVLSQVTQLLAKYTVC
jgi:tRNA threonylcarbamoyladenosine biosynthesis protein TsaE